MTRRYDDRKVFSLWMEYLKRSKGYEELCNEMRGQSSLPLLPVPERYKGKEGLLVNYLIFGDVYRKSFEELWFSRELWKEIGAGPTPELVSMADEVDGHVEAYRLEHGREPTLAELRAEISKDPYRYIRLNDNRVDPDSAMKAFLSLQHEFANPQEEHPFPEPSTRIRLDELKRYLQVYDLSMQGKNWKEIAQKMRFSPSTAPNLQMYVERDLKKARSIIKNVEKVQFPGDYARSKA